MKILKVLFLTIVLAIVYNLGSCRGSSLIKVVRDNCLGGNITWPADSNASYYHLTIYGIEDLKQPYLIHNITIPTGTNNYYYRFAEPHEYRINVEYHLPHTNKVLELNDLFGDFICGKLPFYKSQGDVYRHYECNVSSGVVDGCYKDMNLEYINPYSSAYHKFIYNETLGCFTDAINLDDPEDVANRTMEYIACINDDYYFINDTFNVRLPFTEFRHDC